jgi:hypothetical protein
VYRLGTHFKEGGFYGVPCALTESERYANLPITARLVVRDLFFIAHRVSSPRFYAKESTLWKLLNLDRKTLRAALNAIERAGLLGHTAGANGDLSEFWLYNPTTGALLPEQDGRATPTYNGVLKGKRAQTAAIPERLPIVKQSQKLQAQPEPGQSKARVTASRSDISHAISETQPPSASTERLCPFSSHSTVHYRLDGSPVCGICHPTGITVPPSAGFSEPHKSPMPFTPPTAEELGFSSR